MGGRHSKRGPTGMVALQSLGQCHRGLLRGHSLSECPALGKWPGLCTRLEDPWMWPPGRCAWVRQQNPKAGDNLSGLQTVGANQVLLWMGSCLVHLQITTKIMASLSYYRRKWKQQIKCLSMENWLNQLGDTSSWNTTSSLNEWS